MDGKEKMLIVEDDTDLLKLYSLVFSGSAYDIDTAADIAEAQKKVKENKYNLILMDLMTPQGDNLQTIRQIRENENPNNKTPVIILTNLDAGEKTKKALEFGANECLFKANFTPKGLLTEVTNILKNIKV
jgi:two-component system alkaline phosphatase synthesis response regulator PhoP